MKKKVLSLLICISLVLSLSACSKKEEADTIAIQKKQREFANSYVFKYRVDKNVIKDFCKSIEEQLKKQTGKAQEQISSGNAQMLSSSVELKEKQKEIETALNDLTKSEEELLAQEKQ